jgi:hydroxypyruvate reductase
VRKQLSRVKGGGLARALGGGRLVSLIISDVLGDPLDVIASGPTVPDTSTPDEAAGVLRELLGESDDIPPRVLTCLENRQQESRGEFPSDAVANFVIGANAEAVDAAGVKAVELGYRPALTAATELEGAAEQVGRRLAEMALHMRSPGQPDCLISGGEPTVRLVEASRRGKGGRNGQLALAAGGVLAAADMSEGQFILLSGGTDGEDGPTDAAGALIDWQVIESAREAGLDMADYLARNDSYRFFEQAGGLVKTGPTQTNVCDLRVVLVEQERGNSANH